MIESLFSGAFAHSWETRRCRLIAHTADLSALRGCSAIRMILWNLMIGSGSHPRLSRMHHLDNRWPILFHSEVIQINVGIISPGEQGHSISHMDTVLIPQLYTLSSQRGFQQ